MPEIIFYDNACGLYSHIRSNPIDADKFKNTMLPVDTFHIKSHKESHTTCRLNNDPHLFPELKKPDGAWRFNASAAEITKAWFGRFDAMCRNMGHVRYNFFLDEMIRLHNNRLLEKLEARANVSFIGHFDMSRSSDLP
ncbi:uncharacterized protein MELLADRAFT_72949 [Melampsora larici-populina 98AG31]|uniref:Uncharacterized protein n=1 Tax=Melampsora larici-populina (strain 98AG31 / pathotype 3-4-7) TaxID=747676 RepID=F4S181_MELLP|nr:uncharacterized protein MELLADRAFT_72949 [Melampsora larici-populina 98AG31]EGG01519.1 hypothetical protein MELLADRAFT_72949 [Melampsora larici-populina 98AG31]